MKRRYKITIHNKMEPLDLAALIAITTAVTEVFKRSVLKDKWKRFTPAVSIVAGLLLVGLQGSWAYDGSALMTGLVIGLAASGLYDAGVGGGLKMLRRPS